MTVPPQLRQLQASMCVVAAPKYLVGSIPRHRVTVRTDRPLQSSLEPRMTPTSEDSQMARRKYSRRLMDQVLLRDAFSSRVSSTLLAMRPHLAMTQAFAS